MRPSSALTHSIVSACRAMTNLWISSADRISNIAQTKRGLTCILPGCNQMTIDSEGENL